jgi:peptidoglycan-N-acetylglucosamine deacetylase
MPRCQLLLLAACVLLLAACSNSDAGTPVRTPTPQPAHVLDRGDPSTAVVALMFDVGSDAGRTEDILRMLREQQVRATFVVTGVWAEQHRDLLFSISAEGHQIINGTYDGRSWTGVSTGDQPLSKEERALALSRAEVTVYRYTSQSTRPFFRPPYDDIDDSVLRDAAANGYGTVVMWTVSADVTPPDGIVAAADAGTIVAMRSGDRDADALDGTIDGIRARGFDFVTIGEMSA